MAQRKTAPHKAGREARPSRVAKIGGVMVKIATPKPALPAAKAAKIRSAVRDFYAVQKGK